ncbi:phosphotyrosine protein [Boletus edulis]|uniref:protein-tyrosine-phosphatase n=1 Tax=Boletus edulis BED1 TaxID=1328754 RepID=A0AAD4C2E0_BOLED|nr:phosphotyrosine protein [Boletus edulis]KAF8447230.1 phosphotyrosine protein [Boletus edulis BED1]
MVISSSSQWPPSPIAQTPYPLRPPSASEIIPRLYVSDLAFAENPAALASLGITHVLSAMRGYVAHPPFHPPLHRAQFALDDLPFSELVAHLPHTTAFLRGALMDPNARVLVHCVEGVSRSTSVVAAYLIAEFGWTTAQAVQFVKSRRRAAEPNFGFVKQLQEYAESLGRS